MARIRSECFDHADPDKNGFHLIPMTLHEAMFWAWRVKKLRIYGSWVSNVATPGPIDWAREGTFDFQVTSSCSNEVDLLINGLTNGSTSITQYLAEGPDAGDPAELATPSVNFDVFGVYHDPLEDELNGWYLRILIDLTAYAARLATLEQLAFVPIDQASFQSILTGYDSYYNVQYEHEIPFFVIVNTTATGSITIEPAEYWTFADPNGNPTYDSTTGALMPGMTPFAYP